MGFWSRLYGAFTTEPRSFTVEAEWARRTDEPTEAEPTTEVIQHDEPDWVPPPAAQRDPWRPVARLPYVGYDD